MPRRGRYFLPNQPLHVIQRGNNREPVFIHDDDYRQYKEWLSEAAAEYGCRVHSYVLMTNHVHLLVTPDGADALPRTMQSLGRRYVRSINRQYRRTGTLWEGRYRAAPIDSDEYFFLLLPVYRTQSVRAGMVRHPREIPVRAIARTPRGGMTRLPSSRRSSGVSAYRGGTSEIVPKPVPAAARAELHR